jgi:hypothetical protein
MRSKHIQTASVRSQTTHLLSVSHDGRRPKNRFQPTRFAGACKQLTIAVRLPIIFLKSVLPTVTRFKPDTISLSSFSFL